MQVQRWCSAEWGAELQQRCLCSEQAILQVKVVQVQVVVQVLQVVQRWCCHGWGEDACKVLGCDSNSKLFLRLLQRLTPLSVGIYLKKRGESRY